MKFSAVLLAGGKSSRMGRDKSALPVNGQPLWKHQLGVLHATNPAELFISGKRDGPYANCGVEILADEFPGCGPLGGIATALRRCTSERLLVLAVDMPAMTATFLRTLLDESRRIGMGVVPSVAADGRRRADRGRSAPLLPSAATSIEPLAAVYPRVALAIADECLRAAEYKMESFIRRLEAMHLASLRLVAQEDAALFANWNMPGDAGGSQP